jgi:hypothetical protein
MRKSKEFDELDKSIILTVKTKCPKKWLLVDRETGNVFEGNANGAWDRLDPVRKEQI